MTAVLTYDRTNSGYTTYGTWSGSITINGAATAGSRYLEIGYQTHTEAIRATVRVYHEADGAARDDLGGGQVLGARACPRRKLRRR